MSPPDYEERLAAPAWVWVAALGVGLVVAASLHGGAGGPRAVVPYAVVLPLTALLVVLRSRGRVRVADGVLSVPGARIPLSALGQVAPLDREATRRVRGPLAQRRAFVVTRAWLTQSVLAELDDPEDDTPYWLIGTRHPHALAAALGHAPPASEAAPDVSPPRRGAGRDRRSP